MKWQWKDGGYNRKESGEYSVTKHEMKTGVWEYLAWHSRTHLGASDSFAQAEAACVAHEGAK